MRSRTPTTKSPAAHARRVRSRAAPALRRRRGSWAGPRGARDSRKSLELAEIRFALLDERVAAFLGLFRQVIEERRAAAEIQQADLAVAISVHSRLEKTQRHRRQRQHLAAPLQRLFLEALQRHDRIDQSHFQRLLRVVLTAGEPDLAS